MKNRIEKVKSGSLAEELEIVKGDIIRSINGFEINDVVDYLFLIADEEVVLEIEKEDGEIWEIEVEKDFDEDLGVEFENPILDTAKSCKNKCVFCFVDQLPTGMRETLYFKDDDSRLSFLQGNFVTLTNLKDEDIDRIIRYQISPINVSVHTTNPELRCEMLNNRFAGNVFERLEKLTENNIVVNAQIVLCPGLNDKEQLDRTIYDLSKLNHNMNSVAVVPIGLTKFRDGLASMDRFDSETALEVIQQVEKIQADFLNNKGTRFVFISDEFYVLSNHELPSYEAYEGFEQFEDGIGMLRYLNDHVIQYVDENKDKIVVPWHNRKVTIMTGVSAFKYIKEISEFVEAKFEGLEIQVLKINNDFFGHTITVTGLLTGQDIIKNALINDIGQELLLSVDMFKNNDTIMLDDIEIKDIEKEIGKKVSKVENKGSDFVNKILGI